MGEFEELAFKVLQAEAKMSEEQRLQFWSVILGPYCRHCGTDNPDCRCWDGE